ncbi:MAG: hypothetical protein N2201_06330 [candidate division WOR-3 bacterium]|nr:hypothetical protein [candidate division WOR-3 bacterium]
MLLGSNTAIESIPQSGNCYLEMQVNPYPAISPRIRLVSSAYAYLSKKSDTANYALSANITYIDSARVSTNAHKLQGKDTIALSNKFVDEGQSNSITTSMIVDGNVTMAKINQAGASAGQVLKWTGSAWAPRSDSIGTGVFLPLSGGTMTGPITSTGNPEITMGKGNFGSGNINSGTMAFVAGSNNRARGDYSVVSGGGGALADSNSARAYGSTIGGGSRNSASGVAATVGGGWNSASSNYSSISGGNYNTANGVSSTISGGYANSASGDYATAIGRRDTSAATYSFTTNYGSKVASLHTSSSAFNGQIATASGQTRVGTLSKASGTFTIDHPLDPMNKILNHYFVESPEMVLIYRGSIIIGADGKAVVHLPNYFDALNQNPMIQLTGVGTSDVYVVDEVKGNTFVIGGKPNTKVYWIVTGDRKDQSAEITRIIMPVEQTKDNELRGRSLDDDFLSVTKEQLDRMGKGHLFNFRTAFGQQKYENSKRIETEIERMKE